MATKPTAPASRAAQHQPHWDALVHRLAAADKAIMELRANPEKHEAMCDRISEEHGAAIEALLLTPAPHCGGLRKKLELILELDEQDEPILFTREQAAAILDDFDRMAAMRTRHATPAQPVNHERAASRIQELATQAIHVQAAAEGVLHDDGNAPEAALALLPLAARLVAEIAAIAETIEAGRPLVEKVASRLVGRPH